MSILVFIISMRACVTAIALAAISQFAAAQPAEPLPPAATADLLLECASAHTHNIQLLQAVNHDVAPLYRTLGYFRLAGEAYSSKDYAQQKYGELRAALTAQMDKALDEPEATRDPMVEKFMEDLHARLAECTRYQRAHAPAIRERLGQAGLLK